MQEIIENAEPMEIREQPTAAKEQPVHTPPESPHLPENQLSSQDVSPVRTPSPPPGTPPEAKKLRTSSQKERMISAGNWNGERRGGRQSASPSRSPINRADLNSKYENQMKPLQRLDKMSSDADIEFHKGYHSYAVRTSPVNPPLDFEEKAFPPPQAGTPDLKEEPKEVHFSQKVQEKKTAVEPTKKVKPSEEVKDVKVEKPSVEAKTETKIVQKAEPKTVQKTEPKVVQKPAPPKAEPKVVAKPAPPKPEPKPAAKPESKALVKFDTKIKKGAQAVPAPKAEIEEVSIIV